MRRLLTAVILAAVTSVTAWAGQPRLPETQPTARATFLSALDAMGGVDRIQALTTLAVRTRVVHRDDTNGTDTYEQQDYFRFPDASRSEMWEPGSKGNLRQVMLATPEGWWTSDGTSAPEWHAPAGPPHDPFMMRTFLERLADQSRLPMVATRNESDTVLQDADEGSSTTVEFHFARDTGLLRRRATIATGPLEEDTETFFDDYRRIDGFTVPFTIKTECIGNVNNYTDEVTVLSVTFNPVLPRTLFASSSLRSSGS